MKRTLLFTLLLLLPFSVAAAGLQDPTRPPQTIAMSRSTAVKAVSAPVYSLSSTLISAQRRLAVINGVTVGEGDRIEAATVKQIQPQAVTLVNGQKEWTLTLGQNHVKTLATVINGRITKQ